MAKQSAIEKEIKRLDREIEMWTAWRDRLASMKPTKRAPRAKKATEQPK